MARRELIEMRMLMWALMTMRLGQGYGRYIRGKGQKKLEEVTWPYD
jgi:hypothetical protein